MTLNKFSVKKGFTLVELLLVIVLVAIIMALVTLSGANMVESTNAQTEARKLIRTVHSLRSAWFSCYADSQALVGITPSAAPINTTIGAYSDRALDDEISRYGNIAVRSGDVAPGSIYIGFAGPWNLNNMNAGTVNSMIEIIGNQAADYNISFDRTPIANNANTTSIPRSIMIRVR
ncbi:MAG: prepilin-type N-terminal cleavage/methylation domain-containing protein [Synergistaceae bacterium]|nr:prepilin-type N-terminal cleavage/methylation domain-containing protein [Synergistaceae bacterium]